MELKKLALTESGNWSLVLTNGIEVELGDSEVMEKMRRLLATYAQGLSADFAQIKTIDMRYSNGFAVGWRSEKS
ncbi:cell division protein FtsQ/DivIB [Oceanicoccus sp. KOV_DT_Chl]|uniref:cell division protein FtsQ/DivIB n=1 Tax=Oceanicoccus sp. KOV_DT_Chl TaxID=1904639 RepID=UPI000C7D1742|nr:cell division protein FtsQ/DivIB [Oceanicoccus sp. KOV_DT_Chl]